MVNFIAGGYIYDAILKFNHLEVYGHDEYANGCGLVASLICIICSFILLPIFTVLPQRWLPRKLNGRNHAFLVVLVAGYVLPFIGILIAIAIEGLPWNERVTQP